METLLPSEIARLVYGYLVEEKCNEAADKFLKTSPLLKECLAVSKCGKKFQTRFNGKNLVAVLEVLSQVKSLAQLMAANLSQSSYICEKLNELFDLLGVEIPSSTEINDLPSLVTNEIEEVALNTFECNQSRTEDKLSDSVEKHNLSPSPVIVESRPDSSIDIIDLNDSGIISKIINDLPSTSQALPSERLISSPTCNDKQNAPALSEPVCVDLVSSILDDVVVTTHPDSSSKKTSKDSVTSNTDVVCLSPSIDVIEIDEDEPEDENQDLTTTQCSLVLPDKNSEPQKSFRKRFRKKKNRANLFHRGGSTFKVSSMYKGHSSIPYMTDILNGRARYAAQHANQPSTSSANYSCSWSPWSKANNRVPCSAFSSIPAVMVNRPVLQTSAIGSFSRRRSNLPLQEGTQIISEELVTQVVSNSQPIVSQSTITNRTVIPIYRS